MNADQTNQTPNLEQQLGDMFGINQEQPPQQETVQQEVKPQTTSSDQTTTTETQTTPKAEGDNSTIRQMRDQLKQSKDSETKLKALLERVAASNNTTVEELEAKIQADEDKKNAASHNIPVEIEQRIRQQEQRIRELEEQNLAQNFNARANALITKYGMTEQQFITFAQDMQARGFDVRSQNMDLDLLYRSSNFDALVAQRVEQAKQEMLADMQKQRNTSSSVPNTKQTVSNNVSKSSGGDQVSREDLNNFVEGIFGSLNK